MPLLRLFYIPSNFLFDSITFHLYYFNENICLGLLFFYPKYQCNDSLMRQFNQLYLMSNHKLHTRET